MAKLKMKPPLLEVREMIKKGNMPKDARSMLTRHQAGKKEEREKLSEKPENDAIRKVEDGMKDGARKIEDILKHVMRKGMERSKQRMKYKAKKEAARQAVSVAEKTAHTAAEGVKKMGQLILQSAKAVANLFAAIVAGGVPVILVIILIASMAILIASPFGIFFSNEDTGTDTISMQQAVAETAAAFRQEMQQAISTTPHDQLQISHTNQGYLRTDNWIDVLAIFAVKTSGEDTGTDVVTIDAARVQILQNIFTEMVIFETRTEQLEHYYEETGETTFTTVLHINIHSKGAWEMADTYGFITNQREVLTEMLNGSYDALFNSLIGGSGLLGSIGDGTGVIGTGSLIWPSNSSDYVTSAFGARTHPVTGEEDFHNGIDIAAGENTEVLAADTGTVVIAGTHWSYGNYVQIDHGNGSSTLYAHMNSLLVSAGTTITQGEPIGLVGSTGVSDGAHIHFEVRIAGALVDPLQFFTNYTTAW